MDGIIFTTALIAWGDNGNNNATEDTSQYSGELYDRVIGNGNYTLHNFISDTAVFAPDIAVEATNHYLGKAGTYVKGLANNLNQSLSGRTAAQNYLSNFIVAIQNNDYFQSYKEGLGWGRQGGNKQMDAYNEEKDFLVMLAEANKVDEGLFANIDIEQE